MKEANENAEIHRIHGYKNKDNEQVIDFFKPERPKRSERKMKKYTQEQFEALEVDQHGRKVCPSGDYSAIKFFAERCSFAEWCSFAGRCKYEDFVFSRVVCLFGVFKYPIYMYLSLPSFRLSVGCETFSSLETAVERAKGLKIYCEKTHRILSLILEDSQ